MALGRWMVKSSEPCSEGSWCMVFGDIYGPTQTGDEMVATEDLLFLKK